jgi:tryptophan synthase alpha chain
METQPIVSNRLTSLFSTGKKNILNVYFTAGFPALDDTLRILRSLEKSGVDLVEIGIPFSDPLADGPTIQESNMVALGHGMTLKLLLEQLREIRKEISLPILLMGYLNPVMQYGVEEFCDQLGSIGIDGLILPDLPLDEYKAFYKNAFERNHLSNVFLVTPQTSEARIREIDQESTGFIYVVSTDSTTGNAKDISGAAPYFERIRAMQLQHPALIGFNVKDHSSFSFACQYAQGAIVGSAFIRMLQASKNLESDIETFVRSLRTGQ